MRYGISIRQKNLQSQAKLWAAHPTVIMNTATGARNAQYLVACLARREWKGWSHHGSSQNKENAQSCGPGILFRICHSGSPLFCRKPQVSRQMATGQSPTSIRASKAPTAHLERPRARTGRKDHRPGVFYLLPRIDTFSLHPSQHQPGPLVVSVLSVVRY